MGLLVTPPTAEFRDVGWSDVRTATITVKNTESRTCVVRIRSPKGSFFSIRAVTQSVRLAPGFSTTFEVVFDAGKGSIKDFTQDQCVVQSDFGEQVVILKAIVPQPYLEVQGDLMFGVVPTDSQFSKRLIVRNRGTAVASFRLDFDLTMGLSVTPASADIAPAATLELVADLTTPVGAHNFAGDVHLVCGPGQGMPEYNRDVSFSATVVPPVIELTDPSGVVVKKLEFGLKYFGESVHQKVDIYNNSPVSANFVLTYGSAGEMRGRGVTGADEGSSDSVDDPYASFLLAARQKVRSRATNDNPFSVAPLSGMLAPFTRTTVTVAYAPQGMPTSKGFSLREETPESQKRDFDYLAVIEVSGTKKMLLPIHAKAIPGGLYIDPPYVDFGDVAANMWADHIVTLHNRNKREAIDFKVSKNSPSYEVEPSSGHLLGGQSVQLHVRYAPRSMGHHVAALSLQGISVLSKRLVQKLELAVTGTSLACPSPQRQPVGGPDKQPRDFTKSKHYIDNDQVLASKVALTKKSAKAMTKIWDAKESVDSFEVIGDGTMLAMGKNEYIAAAENKEKYIAALRTKRTIAAKAKYNGPVAEDDVNNGMGTRSGLQAFEPRMPNVVAPLWTAEQHAAVAPSPQRHVTHKELDSILFLKDKPETEAELVECRRELSNADIKKLIIGPKHVDFGDVSVGSSPMRTVLFCNPLDAHIHVVLDVMSGGLLMNSTNNSQVIPPHGKAKFPLVLSTAEPKEVSRSVEYCINSLHVLDFPITASIVPVSIDLSTEDLHFEFSLDSWGAYVEKVFVMNNPHKFAIDYTISTTDPTFIVTPVSGIINPHTSAATTVRWAPVLDGVLSGLQQSHAVVEMPGSEAPMRVFLQGQLPEGALSITDKHVDAGQVPLGVKQRRTFHIKNAGSRESAYRIAVPHVDNFCCTPLQGRISSDDGKDITVDFTCVEVGLLSCMIEIQVLGVKPLKLPFRAEGILPCIDVKQKAFDFGPVYIGSSSKLPLTLVNLSPVAAIVAIDLTLTPDLQIELPTEAWSPDDYETNPLVKLRASFLNNAPLSRMDLRRQSSACSGDDYVSGPPEGARFHVTLNPLKSLNMLLVYRPSEVMPLALTLTACTMTTNAKQHMEPVHCPTTGFGVQPRITLSKCMVNFDVQFLIHSNQAKVPYYTDIYITNADPQELPVQIDFGEPVYKLVVGAAGDVEATPSRPPGGVANTNNGIFRIDVPSIMVEVGEMVGVRLHFTPREVKTYQASIPIYIDGDLWTEYLKVEAMGSGQRSRLSFDTRECILPPVPLGMCSTATFHILNHGYDNLDLRYRMPSDEKQVPLVISFPEGNLIGIAKERLPVNVTFTSAKPLSFTAKIDFLDEGGRRFSIPISGTTDNSLVSLAAFHQANTHLIRLDGSSEGRPLMLQAATEGYKLPDASSCLGTLKQSPNLLRYFNATSGKAALTDVPKQMTGSRGKLMFDLVEYLSGRPIPGKVAKGQHNKKEASEALVGAYDKLLVFLKAHGAQLNFVKPEMLLDAEDLDRLLTSRVHSASASQEEDTSDKWKDVEENFGSISTQAWNSVLLHVFKVFVLARVSLKSFKSLPGNEALEEGLMPADTAIVGSDYYSVPECILLSWLSVHYRREFGDRARRVTNFEEDLCNGLVLFSLLSSYWPALSARKGALNCNADTQAKYLENNKVVVKLMHELGLVMEVVAEELAAPCAQEMLVLVLYLYQQLPQLVPKASIDFYSRLGEVAVKELELTNPSKKAISYSIKLEGSPDFSTEVTVVHIDAKSSTRLPVRCLPTTSVLQEARLVLLSRKESGANAATLVFLLQSAVNTHSPLKRIRCEGPLYELQQFDFLVMNPYLKDCDFSVYMVHEPAEPAVKEDVEQKRRGSLSPSKAKKKGEKKHKGPSADMFPHAFGLDRSRLRLKKGLSEKLKVSFLPFTMGEHFCTIVFKDKEQGEFVYELVGEAGLPPPFMELKALLPLEGPALYDVVLPHPNHQLEAAKRLFLEKHPLAKDSSEAELIRSEELNEPELEYGVLQSNSLVSCEPLLRLSARALASAPSMKIARTPSSGRRLSRQNSARNLGQTGQQQQPAAAPVMGPAQMISATSAVPSNGLRLSLSPIGTGIYPTRLLLTSSIDTRVIDVELMAQMLTQQFQLEFACPCRERVGQDVPLVNNSDRTMAVVAKIEGSSWTGTREVVVPAGATIPYTIEFHPMLPGELRGLLELSIPATGERNIYTLTGRVSEPLAEASIKIECKAQGSVTRELAVPNISTEQTEYAVMCDLDFLSGPETCKTGFKQGALYKMTVCPPFSGTYYGSLSFVSPEGSTVWYALEVHVSEPPEVGTIEVSTQVRKAVAIGIHVINPCEEECEMDVFYSDASIIGPPKLLLPASCTEPVHFEFFYSPLVHGDFKGSVMLRNADVGEFWYQLHMHAERAPAENVPEMTVEIGKRTKTTLRVENPVDRAVLMSVFCTNCQNFEVDQEDMYLAAHGTAELTVEYVPSSVDEEEEALITVTGDQVGEWQYHCVGRGTLPTIMDMTTLTAQLAQAKQGTLTWINPFPRLVELEVKLVPSNDAGETALSLLLRKQPGQVATQLSVPAFGEASIPLFFAPSSLRTATADVIVTASRFSVAASTAAGKPLSWQYPVRALPEVSQAVGSTFEYRCKARSHVVERLEIVLKGIASLWDVEDEFLHELLIPPEHQSILGPDVLSISAVETRLASPNEPLVYSVRFAPQHMFNAEVEFVVIKQGGGRWRFQVHLQALEPESDGVLTVEAAMDQTGRLPVYLYSSTSQVQPYTASFTADTPLQFDVTPSTGLLRPKPPQNPGSPRSPRGAPALEVLYSCRDLGKVVKGRLFVKTADMQYSFDVRGKVPEYRPPQASQLAPTIDSRLNPEMAAKLAEAAKHSSGQPNYVARNLKTGRRNGRQ